MVHFIVEIYKGPHPRIRDKTLMNMEYHYPKQSNLYSVKGALSSMLIGYTRNGEKEITKKTMPKHLVTKLLKYKAKR